MIATVRSYISIAYENLEKDCNSTRDDDTNSECIYALHNKGVWMIDPTV